MALQVQTKTEPRHHIDDDLLLDYASGATDEAQALLVSTHLAYCSVCRRRLAEIEAIGGAMLEEIAPEPVSGLDFDALLDRIDAMDGASPEASGSAGRASAALWDGPDWVPAPLRPYVDGTTLDRWKSVTRGIDEIELPVSGRLGRAKLLRIRAGTRVPQHTHKGRELTLVMQGAFVDADVTYGPGDVATEDHEIDHRPMAGADDDCICLVVLDAPLRLTGPIGRFLNPFMRF